MYLSSLSTYFAVETKELATKQSLNKTLHHVLPNFEQYQSPKIITIQARRSTILSVLWIQIFALGDLILTSQFHYKEKTSHISENQGFFIFMNLFFNLNKIITVGGAGWGDGEMDMTAQRGRWERTTLPFFVSNSELC